MDEHEYWIQQQWEAETEWLHSISVPDEDEYDDEPDRPEYDPDYGELSEEDVIDNIIGDRE